LHLLAQEKPMIGLAQQTGHIVAQGGIPPTPHHIPLKATKLERHFVIEGEHGGRGFVYRHDLIKPTVTLISTEQHGEEWLYTYEVSNDKSAVKLIVSFRQKCVTGKGSRGGPGGSV
jgi:hypothetical protein